MDSPGTDPSASAAAAVIASAGSGVHPSMRSLETVSGTHLSPQCSSTAGSARSGSSRVQVRVSRACEACLLNSVLRARALGGL
eukprot:1157574-Pelagomonas_calceolata.AAC.15